MNFFPVAMRSIRFKLISIAIIIEVIMLGLLVWNGLRLTSHYLLAETESHLNVMTPLMNAGLAAPIVQEDLSTITEILDRMTSGPELKYIEIQNANAELLVKKGNARQQPWLKRADFNQYMNNGHGGDRFAFREPIYIGSRIVGYANIQLDISVVNLARQTLFRQGMAIGLLEVFLTALFLSLVGFALTRHLATLTNSVRGMAAGDYSQRIDVDSQDEIGDVAQAINHLIDEVDRNHKKIIAQSEEIEGLARLSPVGIFQMNEHGQCTYVNPRWVELSGISAAKARGTGWADAIHPDDRPVVFDAWQEVIARPAVFEIEYRFHHDDTTFWVATRVEPQMNQGLLTGYIGSVTDITEGKRIEATIKSLAESSSVNDYDEFLRNVVKSLASAYQAKYAFIGQLLPDQQQVQTLAVWSGEGFADNFVYDLKGTPCQDIIHHNMELIPCDAWRLYPDDVMLKEMGVEAYYGAPLLAADDSKLGLITVMDVKPMEIQSWVEPVLSLFATRVSSEMERQQTYEELVIHRYHLEDLVSLRTAEMQVLNKELEAFSYSVSHDLRAPLRAISGFSSLLTEDYAGSLDEEGLHYLSRITCGANRMAGLIDDMLNLSRVSRADIEFEDIDMDAMASEIIDDLQAEDQGRQVNTSIQNGLSIRADKRLFRIALENLIGNAWKYTGKQSDAIIEIGRLKEGNQPYYIKDNGVGFDMQYASKLFGAFQRMHKEADFEGSGIGLATVQRIILRHGGRVWAESEPGVGSTFFFTLDDPDNI